MSASTYFIGLAGLQESFQIIHSLSNSSSGPVKRLIIAVVDIEALEHDSKRPSEVGVAILDSLDIVGIEAGDRGVAYMQHIRVKHYRIEENSYKNKTRVAGCPELFLFGQSDLVDQEDAASIIQGHVDALLGSDAVGSGDAEMPLPASTLDAMPTDSQIARGQVEVTNGTAEFGGLPTPPPSDETVNDTSGWTVVPVSKRKKAQMAKHAMESIPTWYAFNSDSAWCALSSNVEEPPSALPEPRNGLIFAHGSHDRNNDRKWAGVLGLKWPFKGATTEFDNQRIARAQFGGLAKASTLHLALGIPTFKEHNGGNDAAFELCAAIAMGNLTDDQINKVAAGQNLSKLPQMWSKAWKSVRQPKPRWLLEKEQKNRDEQKKANQEREAARARRFPKIPPHVMTWAKIALKDHNGKKPAYGPHKNT